MNEALSLLEQALERMRAAQTGIPVNSARYVAIVITELEKVIAFLKTYLIHPG